MKKLYFVCDCGVGDKKKKDQFHTTQVDKSDICTFCGNYAVARTPTSNKYITTMNVFESVVDDDPFTVHIDLDSCESRYKTNT